MRRNWISRYWPALVVLAVNLALWASTSTAPGRPVWIFYAGRAFQAVVVVGLFFFCWHASRKRDKRLRDYLEAVRKGMAGYTGVD